MNLYNRMMNAEFAYEVLKRKDYIFLYAVLGNEENGEMRGEKVRNDLEPSKNIQVEYFCNGVSSESKIQEGFIAKGLSEDPVKYNSLRKKDMENFLKKLYDRNHNLVVDFTLMNTRFLGALCGILNVFQWNEVYFCYTEPEKYSKNENDDYDLKNTTMGFDQIPNLETFSDSSTKCDWVIFLGFEGSRLMRLEEESPASKRYSLPYMSIPAMKTEWHNIAMNTNRHFFELKISDQENMEYVSAINPFDTYDRLNRIKNPNTRLVISPIGPKPVMLGCIMYVLENENEMLLFDNPFQEGRNTDEYGDTHFYDLSQYFRSVKNKRFIMEDE